MIKQLSIEDYHRAKGVSKSRLDQVSKSILHYLEPQERKTDSMALGNALHDAILLPDLFEEKYVTKPDSIKVRRGNAWEQFVEDSQGKEIITQTQMDAVLTMRKRVHDHELGRVIFSGGKPEESYFTEFEILGEMVEVKCRPDYVSRDVIIDLKTARDASHRGFSRSIANYRYHVQGAFYLDVINKVLGTDIQEFIFVAIETSAPYPIGIYMLDQESIDLGRKLYMKDLQRLVHYRQYPDKVKPTGYTDLSIEACGCPQWAFYEEMN